MSELKTSVTWKNFRFALVGLGGGAGVAFGIAALKALQARPEFLPQLLSGGFLGFAALMLGMVMFREPFKTLIAVQERNVTAQEQLAHNVGGLVTKITMRDEEMEQRAREHELTLNHLARQSDKLHRQGEEILEEIGQLRRARGDS